MNGQMSKSSDTDDTDTVGWLNTSVEGAESVVDGGTTAHERSGVCALKVVGDLEDVVCVPDGKGSHGCLVQVTETIHDTLGAKGLVTGKTLLAVLARAVLVTPSDGITLLDVLDSRSDLL